MKNLHILPNTEVPIELRLEVYKEALNVVKKDKNFRDGLCVLLPKILWDVECDTHPNGKTFWYNETVVLFPELIDFLKQGYEAKYTNNDRIEFLEQTIKQLSNV